MASATWPCTGCQTFQPLEATRAVSLAEMECVPALQLPAPSPRASASPTAQHGAGRHLDGVVTTASVTWLSVCVLISCQSGWPEMTPCESGQRWMNWRIAVEMLGLRGGEFGLQI